MRNPGRFVRIAAALAGTAALWLSTTPTPALADYNYTHYTTYYAAGYTQTDTHFWESPPGGLGWYSELNWSSNVYTNFWSTTVQFYGQSNAYWWGSHPWCASGLDLTDEWGATGIAISATIGPISGGWGGNPGGPVTYTSSNAVCNAYYDRVQHNYSNVTLNGFDIYTFYQQDNVVVTFSWSSNVRWGPYSWDWVN